MKYNGFIIEKTGQVDAFGFPVLTKRPDPESAASPEPAPRDPAEFAAAKLALEAATGGKNTLILDDLGLPSVMVRVPAFLWSDVIDGAPKELCTAFIVGGKPVAELWVSKFMNVVEHGRAYSLPAREPAHTLTIEEARQACSRKGRGWHLFSNAEWMAIALWCRKNDTIPHGNTRYCADLFAPHETATGAVSELYERDLVDAPRPGPETPERSLGGTSPASWSHDGTDAGIFDLNGNVWDFLAGFRILDGEIQVIPNNDSALCIDESTNSTAWRAILPSGELVAPGTPGTYKYDGIQPGRTDSENAPVGPARLNTTIEYPNYSGGAADQKHMAWAFGPWETMPVAEGLELPFILKALGIVAPSPEIGREISGGADNPQLYFIRNYGERMCARGASWIGGDGFWYLYLRETREFIYPDIGFRAAWVDLDAIS